MNPILCYRHETMTALRPLSRNSQTARRREEAFNFNALMIAAARIGETATLAVGSVLGVRRFVNHLAVHRAYKEREVSKLRDRRISEISCRASATSRTPHR